MPVDNRPKAVMRKIILHTEAETVGMADCHFLQSGEQCRRCHRAAAVNLKIMYGLGCFISDSIHRVFLLTAWAKSILQSPHAP